GRARAGRSAGAAKPSLGSPGVVADQAAQVEVVPVQVVGDGDEPPLRRPQLGPAPRLEREAPEGVARDVDVIRHPRREPRRAGPDREAEPRRRLLDQEGGAEQPVGRRLVRGVEKAPVVPVGRGEEAGAPQAEPRDRARDRDVDGMVAGLGELRALERDRHRTTSDRLPKTTGMTLLAEMDAPAATPSTRMVSPTARSARTTAPGARRTTRRAPSRRWLILTA